MIITNLWVWGPEIPQKISFSVQIKSDIYKANEKEILEQLTALGEGWA